MRDSGYTIKDFGTAIILAGGNSSRMGFDKQFLEINESRIMYDIIDKLEREFDELIIVTNKPEEYKGIEHKVIKDIIVGRGPLAGIHAGLKSASSKYSFIIACDMPNLNIEYISYMKEILKYHERDGCVTKFNNYIEAFNSFYSRDIVESIERHLIESKGSIISLLKKLNIHYVEEGKAREFSPNWSMFSNLNTKEDIELYLKGYNI